jgi:hypothetical protein
MGRCILDKNNFTWHTENVNFLKYLPTDIIYEDSDMFKKVSQCFEENNLTKDNVWFVYYGEWFIKTEEQMKFWICMKPLVNSILNDAFEKTGINTPVEYPIIHFRCADVPFVRHEAYNFAKYEFYKNALEKINEKTGIPYNRVKILYAGGHLSNAEQDAACAVYCESLSKYLESIGYQVEIYTNSDIEDFANLFYAPAVISICGSYSFMSAFFGKGVFITTRHSNEGDTEPPSCETCKEWMLDDYKLKHKDVEDYLNTDAVIKKLQTLPS